MNAGEALVFKAFDSDTNRLQGCPHSAFDDPSCPAAVAPRASIELFGGSRELPSQALSMRMARTSRLRHWAISTLPIQIMAVPNTANGTRTP